MNKTLWDFAWHMVGSDFFKPFASIVFLGSITYFGKVMLELPKKRSLGEEEAAFVSEFDAARQAVVKWQMVAMIASVVASVCYVAMHWLEFQLPKDQNVFREFFWAYIWMAGFFAGTACAVLATIMTWSKRLTLSRLVR